MRIEYDLQPGHYFQFAEFDKAHSGERAEMRTYFLGVVLVVIGAMLVLSGVGYPLHSPLYRWLALVPPLAVYSRAIRLQRAVWRGMEEARQQGYFGKCTLTLSAEGIVTECETVRSERQWKAIRHIVNGSPGVCFYLNAGNFIIVPASAFSEEVSQQAFWDTVVKYRKQAAGMDDPS